MRISPALAPGLYKIKVGLYAGGERLRLQPGPGVIEDEQQRYQTGLLTILPDTTPPKLLDLPLKAGQKITGQFSLHFIATDNVGVERFDLLLDGQRFASITLASNAAPASANPIDKLFYDGHYLWNTAAVTNGTHQLTVRAIDPSGNAAEQSVNCEINNPKMRRPPLPSTGRGPG